MFSKAISRDSIKSLTLFLSGIGLFFSLSKDRGTLSFYRRRFTRVMIPALVISLPYFFVNDILMKHRSVLTFCEDWSTLSFWTHGNKSVWFVSLLVVLYLVYPLIFRIQQKRSVFVLLLAAAAFAGVTAMFFFAPEHYNKHEIALTRIPVFLIGSLTGEMLHDAEQKKKRIGPAVIVYTVLSLILFAASFVWNKTDRNTAFMLYRFGSGGAGVLLSMLAAWLPERLVPAPAERCLKTLGGITLELYLVHVFMMNLITVMGWGEGRGTGIYLLIIAAAITASLLLTFAAVWFLRRIHAVPAPKPKS